MVTARSHAGNERAPAPLRFAAVTSRLEGEDAPREAGDAPRETEPPASQEAEAASQDAEPPASQDPEQGPREARLRLPDFFIIGHAKSGTTALYHMLRAHPAIFMPELKETRYFARELHRPPRRPGRHRHPQTLEEYAALFAAAAPDQRAGEASPSYIRSQHAAARIAQLRPDARMIAILREPASFLHSLHMQMLQAQMETEKRLSRALELEESRRAARAAGDSSIEEGVLYLEHVRYVEQLRRYHEAFGADQVLVIVYDDFRADNAGTVRRVLRFLEIEDDAPIEVLEAHPSVRVRSPRMHRLVRTVRMGAGPVDGAVNAAIKAVTSRRMRQRAVALTRRAQLAKPTPPDEQLMRELRRRVKHEVVALSDYLDRDLVSLWGYDRL
jgi:hypothetical protein